MRIEQLGEGEPEVAVVGGVHGDEPCGVTAVETFIDRAPPVERPVALVVANERAVEAGRRYVDADLNRSFPGDPAAAAYESRLAHELGEAIGGCATLALHSTQSYGGLFALVDRVDEFARAVCPGLSLDAIVETHAAEGRIFTSIPRTIEVECGFQGSDRAAENAIDVTGEFLRATGALTGGSACRSALPVFRLGDPIPKRDAERYEVYAENFEAVAPGEAFAAADGEAVIAEEAFHPVLLSPYGYDDVFGYMAERVGTLGERT